MYFYPEGGYIEIEKLVAVIMEAAAAIAQYWTTVGYPPIVVLGRDSWPLVPVLREHYKIPVHYFLFSRLQLDDEGTLRQWAKEIPPGALVVDTGYVGSIIWAIQKIDPTAKGILLSSEGYYPQLSLKDNKESCALLEHIPKIISRCESIDQDGVAHCPESWDKEEWQTSYKKVCEFNQTLVTRLGVSQEWALYKGLYPQDRVPSKELLLCSRKKYPNLGYFYPKDRVEERRKLLKFWEENFQELFQSTFHEFVRKYFEGGFSNGSLLDRKTPPQVINEEILITTQAYKYFVKKGTEGATLFQFIEEDDWCGMVPVVTVSK